MNAYLNQIIQTFQFSHPEQQWNRFVQGVDNKFRDLKQSIDLSEYIMQPHEYWDRLIEFPTQEDEEIRFLHEDYGTKLHECVYCARLYEAERDLDGWFESWCCDECYALRDEGRD